MRPFEKLKNIVENHPLLDHEALINTHTTYENELIELILREEFLISSNLVPMMALVLSRIGEERQLTRFCISENIWDEMGRGDDRLVHSQILKKLLLNLDANNCNNKFLKSTTEYNDYLWDFFRNKDVSECLAVLAYSVEYLTLFEYRNIKERFVNLGVTSINNFFDVNLTADIIHASSMGTALEQEFPDVDPKQLYKAVDESLNQRILFYDGIINSIKITIDEALKNKISVKLL